MTIHSKTLNQMLLALALGSWALTTDAAPMKYEPIQGFRAGPMYPAAAVIQGSDGFYYGTTELGGADGHGTVFKVASNGTGFTTLVQFTNRGAVNVGKAPVAELLEWSDGGANRWFYGTTREGGAHGAGTIFRVSPTGTFETLVHFTGTDGASRGGSPVGSLILAADGFFYGTTGSGGDHDQGTLFKMTPAGVLTTLFHFNGADSTNNGIYPSAALTESATPGEFYGSTAGGGDNGEGTLFKFSLLNGMTTLVHFTGETGDHIGSTPQAPMIRASDGNYYGTTKHGARYDDTYNDQGTVFKMTPAGVHTPIAGFIWPIPGEHRGMWPTGALVEGDDGDLYGTTSAGGWNDAGTVFKVGKGGGMTVLVDFDNDVAPLGASPMGRLIRISANTFVGTTYAGGSGALGTIFQVTHTGTLTTLVNLTGRGAANEGGPATPTSMMAASDGQLYGTSSQGGTLNKGTVFRCAPDGTITTLVNFTGNDTTNKGRGPVGRLVEGPDGNLYGTTAGGGADDKGTVFKMTKAGSLTTLVQFTGIGGTHPGDGPMAALVDGGDGWFYGSTEDGGTNGDGTLFKVDALGNFAVLVHFSWNGAGNAGSSPGSLVKGTDGNFYGTTRSGGTESYGTAFRVTSAGVLTTLLHFDSFAAHPTGLMQASDGNFYGLTNGTGFPYPFLPGVKFSGNLFRMAPDGTVTFIHDFFGGPDFQNGGEYPAAQLVEAPDGRLYGITAGGGDSGLGTLFRATLNGYVERLVDFTGTSGSGPGDYPTSSLFLAADGHFYGVTRQGGVTSTGIAAGQGQIFRLRFWDYRRDHPITPPVAEKTQPAAMPIAWENAAAGVYDGLLRDSADGTSVIGVLSRLTVTKPSTTSAFGGAVTGTIVMNGRRAALSGKFSTAGVLSVNLKQLDGSIVDVDLTLLRTTGAATEVIRGTITWNGVTALVDLIRLPFNSTTHQVPAALVGRYTLVLPSEAGWGTAEPGGDGWATFTLGKSGTITLTGRIGDGTTWTETSYLSEEMDASLYAALYSTAPTRGRIGGKLVFRDTPGVSDCDGLLQWRKFADPRSVRYPLGFAREVWALGSKYAAPTAGQRALPTLVNQLHNATVNIIDDTLLNDAGQISRVVSWLSTNVIRHYGPEQMTATVTAATGALTGSYYHPVSKLRISFTGVVFQKQALAAGAALLSQTSGAVRIVPGIGLPYPGSEDAGLPAFTQEPASPAVPPATANQTWLAAAVGEYDGVLREAGGGISGGIQNFIFTSARTYTASLWLDGVKHSLKGTLEPDGTDTVTIPRTGTTPLTVNLQLLVTIGPPVGYKLEGTVARDMETFTLDAQQRATYTLSSRSPQEGRYTIVVVEPGGVDPAVEPGGEGFGSLVVSYKSACTGTLTLADGTVVTFAGHVSSAGEWAIHHGLYGTPTKGWLAGQLTFRDEAAVSDLDGTLRWVKDNGALPRTVYPGGFDTERTLVGSIYTPPAASTRAWAELLDTTHNVWVRLAGPDCSTSAALTVTEYDRALTWTTANKLSYYGPEKITLTFNTTTGLVTGTVVDTVNGINQTVGGALLQKQSLVTGRYVSQGRSGRFFMEKR